MATLLREPPVPGTEPAAEHPEPGAAPPEGVVVAFTEEARCEACGATMAPGQDWCLACGTAVSGRLGERAGWRAGATVVGVVLLLVAGAVTAGYAALSGDANRDAATATTVAQVPPATPGLTPPAIPGLTTPTATPGAPATTPTPGATGTPAGTTTGTTTTTTTGATPPRIFPQGVFGTPTANTPAPTTGGTVIPPTITTPTQTTPTQTTPAQTTPTQTTPQTPAGPQTIPLGADALSLYDPYKNATAQGDPADADDNNGDTSWFVTSKNATSMGVGMMVDMESARGVKVLGLVTHTPGFRVEVYGSRSEIPADVLDARWHHITSRSRVDEVAKDKTKAGDKLERVVLGGGTRKFRYYLLWFTTPPDAGPTVRLTQVVLQA